MKMPPLRLLTVKQYWLIPLLFWMGLVGLHLVLRQLRYQVYFGFDHYWPVSLFLPKWPVLIDGVTLVAIGLLWWAFLNWWGKGQKSIIKLIGFVGLLIVATNALQGYQNAWVTPITGEDKTAVGYYHDIAGVTSPGKLLASYTVIQPRLYDHSRVHPPGALLFHFGLESLVHYPAFMSLVMVSLGLISLWLLFDIVKHQFNYSIGLFVVALFGVLPAVQIYFLSSFDAVICTLFLLPYWLVVKWKRSRLKPGWLGLVILSVWLASFVNFGVLWLIPVISVALWICGQNGKPIIHLLLGVMTIHWLINQIWEFNYLKSLLVAISYEGPDGIYLFTQPLSYWVTRFEDVIEIGLFLTPWLMWLLIRSVMTLINSITWHIGSVTHWIKRLRTVPQPTIVGLTGVVSLLGFFLAGAYYTGETARAAMYIYPYLLLLLAPLLANKKPSMREQQLLLSLVFTQTVLMQLFGWYAS